MFPTFLLQTRKKQPLFFFPEKTSEPQQFQTDDGDYERRVGPHVAESTTGGVPRHRDDRGISRFLLSRMGADEESNHPPESNDDDDAAVAAVVEDCPIPPSPHRAFAARNE